MSAERRTSSRISTGGRPRVRSQSTYQYTRELDQAQLLLRHSLWEQLQPITWLDLLRLNPGLKSELQRRIHLEDFANLLPSILTFLEFWTFLRTPTNWNWNAFSNLQLQALIYIFIHLIGPWHFQLPRYE